MICIRTDDFDFSTPFGACVQEYLRDHSLCAGSRRKFLAECGEFAGFVQARQGRPCQVDDLQRGTLHDWMDHLAESLASATVNSKRSSLVALANWAADCSRIPPVRKIKKLVEGRDPPVGWSLEDFQRILEAAVSEPGLWCGVPAALHWRAGLLVVWDTAVRFGELWQADLADVDLARRRWRVPYANRKGRREGRIYELSEQTCDAIRATLTPEDALFDNPRTRLWPFPWRKETAWRHFGRILRRAGLPDDRHRKWHAIRRTSESYAAATLGKTAAAEAVGHSLAVAERHYLLKDILRPPALIDGLPRPMVATFRIVG